MAVKLKSNFAMATKENRRQPSDACKRLIENNCQLEFHTQQKFPKKLKVKKMLFSGEEMLKSLPIELTIGKEKNSSEGIYRISGGRSEMPGGWKRDKNGNSESNSK